MGTRGGWWARTAPPRAWGAAPRPLRENQMCPESPPPPARRALRAGSAGAGGAARRGRGGAGAGSARGECGSDVCVCECACVCVHARGGRGDAALDDGDRAGDSQRRSQGARRPPRKSPTPLTQPGSACWGRGAVQGAPVWAASRRGSGKRALLSVRTATGGSKPRASSPSLFGEAATSLVPGRLVWFPT